MAAAQMPKRPVAAFGRGCDESPPTSRSTIEEVEYEAIVVGI